MNQPTLNQYQAVERELHASEARKAFRAHATVYAIVIPVLVTVNLVTVPEFLWFFFPLAGWGAGLTAHYLLGYRGSSREIARHQDAVIAAAAA